MQRISESARTKARRRMLVRDSEKALLAKAERDRRADEVRHDRSKQRLFERSFESRDLSGSSAAVADASDNHHAANKATVSIDAEFHARNRDAIMRADAAQLPRRLPWLQKLLWAVYRNGRNRRESMAELRLSNSSYWWGLTFLLKFFSANVSKGETHVE